MSIKDTILYVWYSDESGLSLASNGATIQQALQFFWYNALQWRVDRTEMALKTKLIKEKIRTKIRIADIPLEC